MPSLIPNYTYDIFISYRQKDNKGDKWVSGFVEALKTELESTFKEEISVYFDINPQDGLLETHDVDASLQEKIKCLIFIPVISRTYCDPSSFAWEQEFRAFIKMASEDQFGLKVKLPSGNVTSRVLPVQIHDLNPEDKSVIEKELGGALRAIEFIYKEPGVNRPLTTEDDRDTNLNRTKYRNQINKLAISIEEVIHGLKIHHGESRGSKIRSDPEEATIKTEKHINDRIGKSGPAAGLKKWLILAAAAIIVSGIIFTILRRVGNSHSDEIENLEKSIAVLPFVNDSPDKENAYFINGIMEEILNNLQKIKDFRVLSRTSTEQYRETNRPTIPEIAKKLDVNYIIEGSGQKYGNKFVLRVQLLAAKNETHLWGESFEREINETNDLIGIQSQIAQAISKELKATITPEEKNLIEKISTRNLNAYYSYQKAREQHLNFWMKHFDKETSLNKAEMYYHDAIKDDSTFADAYSGLAMLYLNKNDYWNVNSVGSDYFTSRYLDSAILLANHALKYNAGLTEAYYVKGLYYWNTGKEEKALENIDEALKYNPNNWMAYEFLGFSYYVWSRMNKDYVKAIENLNKAISLNHGVELPTLLNSIGVVYGEICGFLEAGEKYINQAFILDGDSAQFYANMALQELWFKNFDKSIEYSKSALRLDSTLAWPYIHLGSACLYSGRYKESLKYYSNYAKWLKTNQKNGGVHSHRIGFAYLKNGYKKEADYWFNQQEDYCNQAINKNLFAGKIALTSYYDLSCVFAVRGEKQKALENLRFLTQMKVFPEWWSALIHMDPLLDNLRGEPEFEKIINEIDKKYLAEHERVGKWLKEKDMQ